jgi:hypothetical protein
VDVVAIIIIIIIIIILCIEFIQSNDTFLMLWSQISLVVTVVKINGKQECLDVVTFRHTLKFEDRMLGLRAFVCLDVVLLENRL